MSKGSISKKEIPTPEKDIRKKRKKKKKKKKYYYKNHIECTTDSVNQAIFNCLTITLTSARPTPHCIGLDSRLTRACVPVL
jgi:hypothetical protein